jgi:hypothetical protein
MIPGFVVGRAKEGQQQTAAHSTAQSKAQNAMQATKSINVRTFVARRGSLMGKRNTKVKNTVQ